ncbi:hypothetical protein BDF19DRAFT_412012 [Syncephalis fuscata]|nr:hypothetical protein BDF19DRAFT_412012 [Syncephalis fuscata]
MVTLKHGATTASLLAVAVILAATTAICNAATLQRKDSVVIERRILGGALSGLTDNVKAVTNDLPLVSESNTAPQSSSSVVTTGTSSAAPATFTPVLKQVPVSPSAPLAAPEPVSAPSPPAPVPASNFAPKSKTDIPIVGNLLNTASDTVGAPKILASPQSPPSTSPMTSEQSKTTEETTSTASSEAHNSQQTDARSESRESSNTVTNLLSQPINGLNNIVAPSVASSPSFAPAPLEVNPAAPVPKAPSNLLGNTLAPVNSLTRQLNVENPVAAPAPVNEADNTNNGEETETTNERATPITPFVEAPKPNTNRGPLLNNLLNVAEPIQKVAAPIVKPIQEVAAPIVKPIQEVAAPIVKPIQEVAAPIVKPIQEVAAPIVKPIQEVAAPIVEPIQEVTAPIVEPIKPVVTPLFRPIQTAVTPIADTVVGRQTSTEASNDGKTTESQPNGSPTSNNNPLGGIGEVVSKVAGPIVNPITSVLNSPTLPTPTITVDNNTPASTATPIIPPILGVPIPLGNTNETPATSAPESNGPILGIPIPLTSALPSLPIPVTTDLPTFLPSVTLPLPTGLPTDLPPVTLPLPTGLPTELPPVTLPLPTGLPSDLPPVTLPTGLPPVTLPPVLSSDLPPVTLPTGLPPVTLPPVLSSDLPPVTLPPVTVPTSIPPVTIPPVEAPSTTAPIVIPPPITDSPAPTVEPPVVLPPVTNNPITDRPATVVPPSTTPTISVIPTGTGVIIPQPTATDIPAPAPSATSTPTITVVPTASGDPRPQPTTSAPDAGTIAPPNSDSNGGSATPTTTEWLPPTVVLSTFIPPSTSVPLPSNTPPVVIANNDITLSQNAALVELKLSQVDYAATANDSIQTAQIFDKLARDVASSLGMSNDRVKVVKLRNDNGSVVAQVAIMPDSSNKVPTQAVTELQNLVEDPNSSLYRNGQVAKYIDPSYKITSQSQNANGQPETPQSGGQKLVVIVVAAILSVLLYAGLTAAFIHTYRRNKRRRERNMAATGYFATPQPQA